MATFMTAMVPRGLNELRSRPVITESIESTTKSPVSVEEPPRTVDDLVRQRARTLGGETIIAYPSSGVDYVDYTMQQLDVFAYRVATTYQGRLPGRTSSAEKPMVVAMLGPSNLEYLITMLALMKLGHCILFLSTRISQEAVVSLITTTNAKALLLDPRYLEVAAAAEGSVPGFQLLEIATRPVFEFSVDTYLDTRMDHGLDHTVETSNHVYIIHSSGSTGLPKPIYQTHGAALVNYSLNMNMRAFITLPLYHNHGICNVFRAIYSGKSIHMYNAELPLASRHLETILKKHQFEIFYGVPYALKLLSESETGIELLRQLKIVMSGGSACPDELGDLLVKEGVNLVSHYGATEVGQLMTSFRPPGDKAWNYVRETERLSKFLSWIPRGPNLFECSVRDGWPAKLTSNQPDGSYATKDLFAPHPTIVGAWKYIARLDDTIVLSNGEKFSPVSLEGRIRSDSWVAETVVFGAGRPYLGLLIVPAPSTGLLSYAEIVDHLWPIVEAANQSLEAYARISKSMMRVLPHDTKYPRTDKGSVIRQAFYKSFSSAIDAAYDEADANSATAKDMNLQELRGFLQDALCGVMAKTSTVDHDTDFFTAGMDSLQAIQLRSEIVKHVNLAGKKLGMNVVFDHPSIGRLSNHLLQLRTGEQGKSVAVEEEMASMVERYSSLDDLPKRLKSSVVLTGVTGSLGAHVAARLSKDPSVSNIYCLVRASSRRQASERMRDSLAQRKVYHALPLASRKKLLALPFDQSDKLLGLPESAYWSIASDLRSVIHCAWSVNFNLHLSSFEKDCIAGVRNLLSLCLAADKTEPASFNFCSSVSAVARFPGDRVPETLVDMSAAQEMGYARSKAVAEHICIRAAETMAIKARVLRVGQIIADTQHGIWNAAEAIPLMMQAALTIGALPRLRETPSWLPVDTVAQAVIDISLSPTDSLVANIANRRAFDWTADLLPALRLAGLEFEEVEPKEWVCRLRASNSDPAANPPIKLVDFFATKYDKDEFAPSKTYETEKACNLSQALAEASVLDQTLVGKFVQRFRATSWQAPQATEPRPEPKAVVVLTGPSGSGEPTIGPAISSMFGGAFIDGDRLRTRQALETARTGASAIKDDRQAWLARIKSHVQETTHVLGYNVVFVSCSALRRGDRDSLRRLREPESDSRPGLEFQIVNLEARNEVLMQRLGAEGANTNGEAFEYDPIQDDEDDVVGVDAEADTQELLEELRWAVGRILRPASK